jgi:hypothetical protein
MVEVSQAAVGLAWPPPPLPSRSALAISLVSPPITVTWAMCSLSGSSVGGSSVRLFGHHLSITTPHEK